MIGNNRPWRKIVGERFRDLREEKGLSRLDAARLSGLSWGMIERIETGNYPISLQAATELAQAYEVNLARLISGIHFGGLCRKPVPLDVAVKLSHQLGVSLDELAGIGQAEAPAPKRKRRKK